MVTLLSAICSPYYGLKRVTGTTRTLCVERGGKKASLGFFTQWNKLKENEIAHRHMLGMQSR